MAFPAPNEIPEPESMLMVVAVRTTEDKKPKRNQKDISFIINKSYYYPPHTVLLKRQILLIWRSFQEQFMKHLNKQHNS